MLGAGGGDGGDDRAGPEGVVDRVAEEAVGLGCRSRSIVVGVRFGIRFRRLDLDVDGVGAFANLGGGAVGDEATAGDDEDAGAGAFDLGDDVGAEEDGAVLGEFGDEGAGGAHLGGVEPIGGFVEDEDRGVVDEGGGEADPLAVALAEGADAFVGVVGEAAPVDGAFDGGAAGLSGEAEQAGPIIEVLGGFEFVVEGADSGR